MTACRSEVSPGPGLDGWCALSRFCSGEDAVLADCAPGTIGKVRFIGSATPVTGAKYLMTCFGIAYLGDPCGPADSGDF